MPKQSKRLKAGLELVDQTAVYTAEEAIELAKTYGGTDGHKFVNGVLDKLAPQLRPTEATPR